MQGFGEEKINKKQWCNGEEDMEGAMLVGRKDGRIERHEYGRGGRALV